MLISVACYQFSSFSLSPQNYKSVVPTALFIPVFQLGTIIHRKRVRSCSLGAGSERRIHPSRKATHCRLQGGGGCSLATGPFWDLFTEPLCTGSSPPPRPRKISQGGWVGKEGGVWIKQDERREKMRSLCLPSILLRTRGSQRPGHNETSRALVDTW